MFKKFVLIKIVAELKVYCFPFFGGGKGYRLFFRSCENGWDDWNLE